MPTVTLLNLVDGLFEFYGLLIFVYVIMSWFKPSGVFYDIYKVLATIIEPYVRIFRRFMPTPKAGGVGIDFSPLVAYLILSFVIQPVVMTLLRTLLLG